MIRALLATHGPVETDAEVPADARRIDLWFMPDASLQPVPDAVGLIARITAGPSTLEFFHRTPGGDELAGCLIKHGEFRHFLSRREPPPPVPMQWVISSGCPEAGIEGLWLRPVDGWPCGIYEGPPLLWTRLVVVNETSDDEEFFMTTQDIVENWRQEAKQEGRQEGLEKGREKGREEGLQEGVIKLYEVRFGVVPEDLRAVIEDTHDRLTLLAWLTLTGTRGADEVAAAIRATRAS